MTRLTESTGFITFMHLWTLAQKSSKQTMLQSGSVVSSKCDPFFLVALLTVAVALSPFPYMGDRESTLSRAVKKTGHNSQRKEPSLLNMVGHRTALLQPTAWQLEEQSALNTSPLKRQWSDPAEQQESIKSSALRAPDCQIQADPTSPDPFLRSSFQPTLPRPYVHAQSHRKNSFASLVLRKVLFT